MKALLCEQASQLIGAYVDQELDAETRRAVAAHVGSCSACSVAADDVRRVSRQVAAIGREPAPEHLIASVRARLAEEATEPAKRWGWLQQAAVLLIACGLTAAVTAMVMSRATEFATLERETAAAHVRSLLQESPIQIASSDAHTVKPWFIGRLDFAPAVKDLAADGFSLAGARLDYIGDRRVAALVYRRRLHIISVFLWPSAGGGDSPLTQGIHRGYNTVAWSKGGITYWAVSDLNMGELSQLQGLL